MRKTKFLLYFLVAASKVVTEEVATPASLLGPRHFNHHPYEAGQALKTLKQPEPTKKGPVLFPNDAPPPPRPPLIVTSRPLIESLIRSELSPTPNNSIAEQSQINGVTYRPEYLGRDKIYKPFGYSVPSVAPSVSPFVYDFSTVQPFAHVVNKARSFDTKYQYEGQTALPPIYQALSGHAEQGKILQTGRNIPNYDYQAKGVDYKTNERNDDGDNEDYSQHGQNYAFSYTVKDHKTGDDFSHSQHSSGSATNGEYRVRLPDGRMQIVSYTADENGYKADVRYDEEDKTAGNTIDNHYNDNHNDVDHDRYNVRNDNHNDINGNHYNIRNNNHDYVQQREFKPSIKGSGNYQVPKREDYYNQYPETSKEFYNDDYSYEYGDKSYNYEPHKSKFSSFSNTRNANPNIITPNEFQSKNIGTVSTVKPSYAELKDIFVTKKSYTPIQPTADYLHNKIPVVLNVPSTTPNPNNFDVTTEHVVFIGTTKPHLYTNIRSSLPPINVTPSPIRFSTPSTYISPSPANYLASTISSLVNNVDVSGTKPVLTNNFLQRINKYLTY